MSALINTPEVQPTRPSPEEIDVLVAGYLKAKVALELAHKQFTEIEEQCIKLVSNYGVVPPKAENSRRLEGKTTELTVTTGNTITIDEARVQDLKAALGANGFQALFPILFQERIRHELTKGADLAIVAAGMPKRLTEKVQALFGRCFDAKKKKPSLKVKELVAPGEKKIKRVRKVNA
jgi:hypothetical protein